MNALAAVDRARRAWERTQPQLVIDGWADMMDGLDEPQVGMLRLVEPASPFASPGGLDLTSTEQGANLEWSRALLREGA